MQNKILALSACEMALFVGDSRSARVLIDVRQLSVVAFAEVWLLSDGVDGTLWKADRGGGDVDVGKGSLVCGVD